MHVQIYSVTIYVFFLVVALNKFIFRKKTIAILKRLISCLFSVGMAKGL